MGRVLAALLAAATLGACKLGGLGGDDSPCTSAERECTTASGDTYCVKLDNPQGCEPCPATAHLCLDVSGGQICVANDSPLGCGSRCDPCPVLAGGIATCLAGACGQACPEGAHRCGDACADDRAAASCGASCQPCPDPAVAHAVASCLAGACGYDCLAGFERCVAGCCAAPATGVTGPAALATGVRHGCALAAGGLKCWGRNDQGQVGSGSAEAVVLTAATVPGSASFRQVAGGYDHGCAVDLAGDVHWWGAGQRTPAPVAGLHGATWVAAGGRWCCAALLGGTVECWSAAAGAARTPLSGLSTAVAVAGSWGFGCAVTGAASLACWGDNGRGQLGNPAVAASEPDPVPATNLAGITRLRAVALGQEHACAAYDAPGVDGAVRCWGRGSEGQLGHGAAPAIQRTGVEVVDGSGAPLSGVVGLAAGSWHSCALTGGGAVWCWGGARSTAAPVAGLGPAAAIAAGESHTCALVDGGGGALVPWCWGGNGYGQLGDGTQVSREAPAPVSGF